MKTTKSQKNPSTKVLQAYGSLPRDARSEIDQMVEYMARTYRDRHMTAAQARTERAVVLEETVAHLRELKDLHHVRLVSRVVDQFRARG